MNSLTLFKQCDAKFWRNIGFNTKKLVEAYYKYNERFRNLMNSKNDKYLSLIDACKNEIVADCEEFNISEFCTKFKSKQKKEMVLKKKKNKKN